MSMEIIFEEIICDKYLKIILYENFEFKLKSRNKGISSTDLNCMKEIINTFNYALKYLKQNNFGIEQLGHRYGDKYKERYYIYNQDGYPHRIVFFCCNKIMRLVFSIGNTRRVEFFNFSDGSSSTDKINVSQSCFLKLSKILPNIYNKMVKLRNNEPERKKILKVKVKNALIKLSNVFEELTFNEIAEKIGHTSPQRIEEIRKIIEDLLFEGELNARIRQDTLVFSKPMAIETVNILGEIKDDTVVIKEDTSNLDLLNDIKSDTSKIKEDTSELYILKDIKDDTELIKEHTSKLEDLLENIEEIEIYLKEHLTSDYEKLKNSFKERKQGKISKKELAKRIAKIIGKNALKILINRIL